MIGNHLASVHLLRADDWNAATIFDILSLGVSQVLDCLFIRRLN
jgi:hypothetical protein